MSGLVRSRDVSVREFIEAIEIIYGHNIVLLGSGPDTLDRLSKHCRQDTESLRLALEDSLQDVRSVLLGIIKLKIVCEGSFEGMLAGGGGQLAEAARVVASIKMSAEFSKLVDLVADHSMGFDKLWEDYGDDG